MPIRFRCPNCDKNLSVRDELAGKKANCPGCKKLMVIPVPTAEPAANGHAVSDPSKTHVSAGGPPTREPMAAPVKPPPSAAELAAQAEKEALDVLAEEQKPVEDPNANKTIDFECQWCGEPVKFPWDMGGKQAPCPHPDCKRILRIPQPKVEKPKDWRELAKKGPAAALINQPEKIDEAAWGSTTDKTRVSRVSLVEAAAVPEGVKPPLGWAGWARRLGVVAAVVGVTAGLAYIILNLRNEGVERHAISEILKDAKAQKMHPVPMAEIHRVYGEMLLTRKTAKSLANAKSEFTFAQSLVRQVSGNSAIDRDLFLGRLAVSQLGLAGRGDDLLTKARFEWRSNDIARELFRTLKEINAPEAKGIALRELSTLLIEANEPEILVGLATNLLADLGTRKHDVEAQRVAVLIAKGRDEVAANMLKPPVLQGKKTYLDMATRLAYTEGWVRAGKLNEAKELATQPGSPSEIVDACLGAASVILSDRTKSPSDAAPFVQEAMKFVEKRADWSPWTLIQLARVCSRTEIGEDRVKTLLQGKSVAASVKMRGQYELFSGRSQRADKALGLDVLDPLIQEPADKESPAIPLAWYALAQTNARFGAVTNLEESAKQKNDERLVTMVRLGQTVAPPANR